MICVSIAEGSPRAVAETAARFPFAEIRMDALSLALKDVRALFSGHANLVATFRPGKARDPEREAFLSTAIESGAAYVDIELGSDSGYRDRVIEKARGKGCKVIISFHDYRRTPAREALDGICAACFDEGANIAKIACTVRSQRESARLLGLLDDRRPIVVVGMGTKGRSVRLMAPLLGSPFTYAAVAHGRETADGQIAHDALAAYIFTLQQALKEEHRP